MFLYVDCHKCSPRFRAATRKNSDTFKSTFSAHSWCSQMPYFKTAELINYVGKTVHAPHCFIESRFSLSLRVMLGIRLRWSSTHLPTQLSISDRTAGSLAPESNRSFALSLQCIVHLVRRSWEGKEPFDVLQTQEIRWWKIYEVPWESGEKSQHVKEFHTRCDRTQTEFLKQLKFFFVRCGAFVQWIF